MDRKITVRLQTPADENGDRMDMHPVTTTDEVIVNADSDNAITLTEKLESLESQGKLSENITISSVKPNHACIWAQIDS